MNRIQIIRGPSTDEGTFGEWQADTDQGLKTWVSMELPWRDNQRRISCIPAGIYVCTLTPSHMWTPRADGRVYHVTNVPGRDSILIHAANWAGDVTKHWHSDLLGCISIGRQRCSLTPQCTGKPQAAVNYTRESLTELMDLLDGEDFELEIR